MKYKRGFEILRLNVEARVLMETELMLLKKIQSKRTTIETKLAKLEKKEKLAKLEKKEKDGNEQ